MPIHASSSMLASTHTSTLPDVSVGHALIQMVLALAVIVLCIWGLSKVLGRLRNGATAPRRRGAARRAGAPAKGLTVLSRHSLGKDLSIAAVRWGEREVLVGIAGSTITFLDEARSEVVAERSGESPALPSGDSLEARVDGAFAGAVASGNLPEGLAASLLASRASGHADDAGSRERPSFLAMLREATLRR